MSKIPIRDIIIGVNVAEHSREDGDCNRKHTHKSSPKRDNGKKPSRKLYIILLILNLVGFFIIIPLINLSVERKENQRLAIAEAFVAETLADYEFNLDNDTIWSDTQGFTSIKMSYGLGYAGNETNSIKVTYVGKAHPRRKIGGISFLAIYYDEDGKGIAGCYLFNDICKKGDEIEFTDMVFDLAPGTYTVKIFASDSLDRPLSLPKKR